jgi:hypothetical protein
MYYQNQRSPIHNWMQRTRLYTMPMPIMCTTTTTTTTTTMIQSSNKLQYNQQYDTSSALRSNGFSFRCFNINTNININMSIRLVLVVAALLLMAATACHAQPSSSFQVTSLPGYGAVSIPQWTGYLLANKTDNTRLFYWFLQANTDVYYRSLNTCQHAAELVSNGYNMMLHRYRPVLLR